MIIMGIDPGTATTGWGIIEIKGNKPYFVSVGIISTPANASVATRLEMIYTDLCSLFSTYQPQTVVVEQLFFNTNTKTALTVGQARGVVLLTAQLNKTGIFSYTPLQVKVAISGYGRADKKQVQLMVQKILQLPAIPTPDDAADALAIALTHFYSQKIGRLKQ